MKCRSQIVCRNASAFKSQMEHFVPIIQQHNIILDQVKTSKFRSVSQKMQRMHVQNQDIKLQALNTHYSEQRLNNQLDLKEKSYKYLKDQINQLVYQKKSLQRKLQKQQEIISTGIQLENIDQILFLENRLDELKLRLKESQQIQDIYTQSVEKLKGESMFYSVNIQKAIDVLQVFDQDLYLSDEVLSTAEAQNQIMEQNLLIAREQLVNIQLTNKVKIEESKHELRQSLKVQPLEIIKNYSFEDISPERKQNTFRDEFIYKIVAEKLLPNFNLKTPQDLVRRVKLHKNNLNEEKQEVELKLSLIDIDIRSTTTELKNIHFDIDNNVARMKSSRNSIDKQQQIAFTQQIYLKQKVNELTHSYEKISDFFRELFISLQLFNEKTDDQSSIVQSSEGSINALVSVLQAKLLALDKLISAEDKSITAIHSINKPSVSKNYQSQRRFIQASENDSVYLEIFGQDKQSYSGELPNNIRIQFEGPRQEIEEGVYKSVLNEGLRKTRGFRLDREQIKKESLDYAQNIVNEQLRRDGYL